MPVRVYQPEARPVVVYLHGGGFVVCDLETHDSLVRRLAAATGACVVAVDYRRAPEHPWPAAVDDAVVVLTTLASGDTPVAERGDPLAVAGDSAGGMLAVLAALRQPGIPLWRAVWLGDAGVPVRHWREAGAEHNFPTMRDTSPEAATAQDRYLAAAAELLRGRHSDIDTGSPIGETGETPDR